LKNDEFQKPPEKYLNPKSQIMLIHSKIGEIMEKAKKEVKSGNDNILRIIIIIAITAVIAGAIGYVVGTGQKTSLTGAATATDLNLYKSLAEWKPLGVRMYYNDYTTLPENYLIRYTGATKSNSDSKVIRIKEMSTGNIKEIPYSMEGNIAVAKTDINGKRYILKSETSPTNTNFAIRVDQDII